MSDELSQADQIDKALLDALCHPENRKTGNFSHVRLACTCEAMGGV